MLSFCFSRKVAQSYSNAAYGDPFWTSFRGEKEPSAIRNYISPGNFCDDSGATSKIIAYFRTLDKSLWGSGIVGLVETLSIMRDAYPCMFLTVIKGVACGVCVVSY